MTVARHDEEQVERGHGPVPGQRPLLVFFMSPRSGRAKRVEGFLAQTLQRRHNHETFEILAVDVDARPDLVEHFRITALPALAVVEGRKLKGRLEDPRGLSEIEALLQPWLR